MLTVEDWKVTLTSTHRGALNRQVTEAVKISNEGLGSLLNLKQPVMSRARRDTPSPPTWRPEL